MLPGRPCPVSIRKVPCGSAAWPCMTSLQTNFYGNCARRDGQSHTTLGGSSFHTRFGETQHATEIVYARFNKTGNSADLRNNL